MGMGRCTTAAIDLPHRSASPTTLPTPISARRCGSQTHCGTVGFTSSTRRRCAAGAAGMWAEDRRVTRPRTRLHPRDPRARVLAQGPTGQARLRTHGPPRRGSPHPRRPHHRDPLTRSTHGPPPHRSTRGLPIHPSRKTTLAERSTSRAEPGGRQQGLDTSPRINSDTPMPPP